MSDTSSQSKVLFVRSKEPSAGDPLIEKQLEKLGFEVASVVSSQAVAPAFNDEKMALIIISSTAKTDVLGYQLLDCPLPVIVLDVDMFRFMKLSEVTDDSNSMEVELDITGPGHPLAANLIGPVRLCDTKTSIPYGRPVDKAIVIASLLEDPQCAVIFAYESGEEMIDGVRAPARRVGMAFKDEIIAAGTTHLWALFERAVRWAIKLEDKPVPKTFSEIFREEWGEIHDRRYRFSRMVAPHTGNRAGQKEQSVDEKTSEVEKPEEEQSPAAAAPQSIDGKASSDKPPENLAGLALSGGGIRSATFALGLLQGLKANETLYLFDYLSTVSGGGYLGGWWSAWLARELDKGEPEQQQQAQAEEKRDEVGKLDESLFPSPEKIMHASGYKSANGQQKGRQPTGPEQPTGEVITEGSFFAGRDPIHHLRLFSNYLTPRKGTLSGDTWRAVAIVTRNIVMTWLILVPMLFAAVVAGQLYFLVQTNGQEFVHMPPPPVQTPTPSPNSELNFKAIIGDGGDVQWKSVGAPMPVAAPASNLIHHYSPANVLQKRALVASWPLIALAGWIVVMVSYWMTKNTSGSPHLSDGGARALGTLGGIATWLLIAMAIYWSLPDQNLGENSLTFYNAARPYWIGIAVWVLIGIILVQYARRRNEADNQSGTGPGSLRDLVVGRLRNMEANRKWRREVIRNQIIRIHASLLVLLFILAFVLLLAGFGHEIAEYLFEAGGGYIKKAGGALAVLLSILGSIYMAVKSSPSGGGSAQEGRMSPQMKIIFAVTPPLVMVVLTIALAWGAHMLLYFFAYKGDMSRLVPLDVAAFISIFLAFIFAAAEIHWPRASRWWWSIRVWTYLVVTIIILAILSLPIVLMRLNLALSLPRFIWPAALALMAASGILILTRLAFVKAKKEERERRFSFALKGWLKDWKPRPRTLLLIALAIAVPVIVAIFLFAWDRLGVHQIQPRYSLLAIAAIAVLVLCLITLLFETFTAEGPNRLSLWLIFSIYLLTSAMLILSTSSSTTASASDSLAHAALGLIALALGWVIALGWMADPNMLSLHAFYKERLVRGYLGASNMNRNRQEAEITEAVEGDDVALRNLKNCQRGAPYHLINTTLNLVGGRDLTTAQRSSAMFVLTKRFCGSTRTLYRRTAEYMNGQMMLGTGVAISGAAASPSMGALKITAAQAMLLTLLNVRLGYWAPTPSKEQWRSSHARLWPFYMLREFLSQTNDLASYCYLTDGGHFDNLGLYSLIERGCRLVVVADATADPKPCFSDLGDVIRRCRIDFGAEIDLTVDAMRRDEKTKEAATFVMGTITYSKEHLDALGWEKTDEDNRRGIIILIKPAMTAGVNADIRQYSLENDTFPDQTTADLFFDEAQFESYRKLGEFCARLAFTKLDADADNDNLRKLLKTIRAQLSLSDNEKISPRDSYVSDR